MLIDTENKNSISMADSLNYEKFQTWNYYSLIPKKIQILKLNLKNLLVLISLIFT